VIVRAPAANRKVLASHAVIWALRRSRPAANVVSSVIGMTAAVDIWRRLKDEIFDPYRPELHYMRGPGPKWREKHAQAESA
jgi:hypothetical protein